MNKNINNIFPILLGQAQPHSQVPAYTIVQSLAPWQLLTLWPLLFHQSCVPSHCKLSQPASYRQLTVSLQLWSPRSEMLRFCSRAGSTATECLRNTCAPFPTLFSLSQQFLFTFYLQATGSQVSQVGLDLGLDSLVVLPPLSKCCDQRDQRHVLPCPETYNQNFEKIPSICIT